ncbi:MAG: hypothetical protein QGD94_12845, partial [Planctomycetia bacterium]|nr:hypothetical protein [Planctomycetia bacterium]
DGAFEGTLRLCRRVGFSKVHIFPFSARPGTPAAEMDAKVPAEVIKSRCRSLAEVAGESARRYRASLIGTRARIIVETMRDGVARGLSERYVRVTAPAGPGIRRGQFLDIQLAEVTAEGMAGESLARARV